MAICPFATQNPISGPSGSYIGGPARIVHHTTEGSTAAGAFGAFAESKSDPHFTVDRTTIFQHINTDVAARALRHPQGTAETNRLSAIQIEVVGFAGKPKDRQTLSNVARLCRWIEAQHSVPRVWPNGHPIPPNGNGEDPGGHNRNLANWKAKGGHYGHSQVPNNTHWDPGYTEDEVLFLMESEFEISGNPINAAHLSTAFSGISARHFAPDMKGAKMGPLHVEAAAKAKKAAPKTKNK